MSRESCACQSGRWMSHTARSSLLWKKPKLFSHASMQGRLCEYSGTFFSGSFFLHSSMSQVLPPVAIAWHLWHTILINPICCICLLLPHAPPAFPPSTVILRSSMSSNSCQLFCKDFEELFPPSCTEQKLCSKMQSIHSFALMLKDDASTWQKAGHFSIHHLNDVR